MDTVQAAALSTEASSRIAPRIRETSRLAIRLACSPDTSKLVPASSMHDCHGVHSRPVVSFAGNTRVRMAVNKESRRASDSKAQALIYVRFVCARVLAAIEAGIELRGIESNCRADAFRSGTAAGGPVEPLVTALADEIDPQAAACHRDGKPADACQYPRCVDVKSAERIGLASTTRDTRAPRLKPTPSVGIKEDRLLRSASVVTPRQ